MQRRACSDDTQWGSVQPTSATDNRRHATNGEDATDATQRATHNVQTACAMQRAVCSKRHATRNGRHATTWKKARTTACNGQQATRQQTAGGLRHAGNTAQKTAKTGSACNRQRASDSRPHARARKHLRDATGNTRHRRISHFVCGEQRAADNQQHGPSLVLDNQRATRHRRHTSRCNMPQTHMKIHGVRRTKSGGSRTSGLCQLPPYHRAGKRHPDSAKSDVPDS